MEINKETFVYDLLRMAAITPGVSISKVMADRIVLRSETCLGNDSPLMRYYYELDSTNGVKWAIALKFVEVIFPKDWMPAKILEEAEQEEKRKVNEQIKMMQETADLFKDVTWKELDKETGYEYKGTKRIWDILCMKMTRKDSQKSLKHI